MAAQSLVRVHLLTFWESPHIEMERNVWQWFKLVGGSNMNKNLPL